MDATVASGAAAMMAIRILLDHEVPEENIMLCSLLMAVSGVHSIAYAFPRVLMITTEVDPEVNDKFYILPGIGREEGRQHDRAHTGDSHVDYFLLFPQETMATGTLERKATTRRSMRTDEPCSVVHNGSWPHCRRRVLVLLDYRTDAL